MKKSNYAIRCDRTKRLNRRHNRSHGDTRYGGQRSWIFEQARKHYGRALFAPENEALFNKLCLYERGCLS